MNNKNISGATRQLAVESPIGLIFLSASEMGITRLDFGKKGSVPRLVEPRGPQLKFLRQAERELKAYFTGRLKKFTVPLDTQGTDFQTQVWAQLRKIPFGKTCSYRDIAQNIGNPKATRAVGTANGRNPIGIIVPCHRVIAADGTLGGYAGGLKIKEELLQLERRS